MTKTRRVSIPAALSLALALSLASSACSGGAETSAPQAQGPAVEVTPSTATLVPGQARAFEAIVTGLANTAVAWSVAQGSAGGTITSSGAYTAPPTAGVFQVVATSQANPAVSGSATVTVTVTAPPPGSYAMTSAHRTTGVAPLAVFFDAVDDVNSTGGSPTFAWTSGVYQPTDKEGTLYAWDFGDPGSGTWSVTGNPKNTATGFTAAHVFENPGTYTVTLTQTDVAGAVRVYYQTITVSAFSGTTYYVASSGRDSNDGLSTTAPFATLDKAMTTALAKSGPVQILLRRGDSWNANAAYAIAKAGPGIIGAYSDGTSGHTAGSPRPIVTAQAGVGEGCIFFPRNPGNDWRVMDIDFRAADTGAAYCAVGPPVSPYVRDLLIFRCRGQDFNFGAFGWGDWWPGNPAGYQVFDAMFVVDSESTSPSGTYGMFVGGRRVAVLGSDIHDIASSHALRVWEMHKGVISNNALWNPGGTRHALKLHSTVIGDGRPETRWVTVSDNRVRGKVWSVNIGAQDNGSNERPTHIVYERNRHWGEQSVQIDIRVHDSADIMIRNNVLDGRGASDGGWTGIVVTCEGGVLSCGTNARIYNNTISRMEAFPDFTGIEVSGGFTNAIVRNNFTAYGSAGTVNGSNGVSSSRAGSGFVADHNAITTSPGFTDVAKGDFTLTPGSAAVNAGATLPEVREDILRNPRPAGGVDLGGFESP